MYIYIYIYIQIYIYIYTYKVAYSLPEISRAQVRPLVYSSIQKWPLLCPRNLGHGAGHFCILPGDRLEDLGLRVWVTTGPYVLIVFGLIE